MMVAWRNSLFVPLSVLLFVASGCTRSTDDEGGSNTNWVTCETSTDCQGDGGCICGLCTQTCETDEDCSADGRTGYCVDPVPASEKNGCAAIVRNAAVKICLSDCREDAECGEKSICIKGACWPIEEAIMDVRDDSSFLVDPSPQSRDAEVERTESTDIGTVDEVNVSSRPSFLEGMNAKVDFDEPIYLPEPETVIAGTFSNTFLVGVWESDFEEDARYRRVPIRLSIEEASDGRGIVGRVTFLCRDSECESLEPLSTATDPNVGYPTGISAEDQSLLRLNNRAKFDYRVFEGRVVGNRFSFWITNNDLWRDWCALQTPYPFENDGRQEYSCVPEPRPKIDLDLDLYYDLEDINGKELLCSVDYSVCKCNSDTCDIDYRSCVRSFDLFIDDDVMQGTFVPDYADTTSVTLIRQGEQQS